MKRLKVGSLEWAIIAGTILKYVEGSIPANGMLYSEQMNDALDEEGCFNIVVKLLASGKVVLMSDGKSTFIRAAEELGQEPVPKPMYEESFFGKYNEAKKLFQK